MERGGEVYKLTPGTGRLEDASFVRDRAVFFEEKIYQHAMIMIFPSATRAKLAASEDKP